jgi:hypothetical protein
MKNVELMKGKGRAVPRAVKAENVKCLALVTIQE